MLVVRYRVGGDDGSVLLFHLDCNHALSAAPVARELLELASLAVAVLGRDEERLRVVHRVERDDGVALAQTYAPYARRRAPHAAHVGRCEAHRAAVAREHDYVLVAAHDTHVHQLVAFVDVQRALAVLVHALQLQERRLLHRAVARREEHVHLVGDFAYRQQFENLLAFLEVEEVDERLAEARLGAFRNLVGFLAE